MFFFLYYFKNHEPSSWKLGQQTSVIHRVHNILHVRLFVLNLRRITSRARTEYKSRFPRRSRSFARTTKISPPYYDKILIIIIIQTSCGSIFYTALHFTPS